MRSFLPLAACVVVALSFAAPANAQFRNQAFTVQVGWLGLGTTWDTVVHGRPALSTEDGWNIHDNPTLGVGHTFAIGYQAWIDTQAALGFSTTILEAPDVSPVMSLQIGGGIRYNFLEERHRPYVAMHLQTLTLFAFDNVAPTPIPTNSFFGNTPFFGGARPAVGYEWIFGDEMSFNVELGFVAWLAPSQQAYGNLFLPGSVGRIGWLIYF